jgi:uncharacterized protein (DUF924 family)
MLLRFGPLWKMAIRMKLREIDPRGGPCLRLTVLLNMDKRSMFRRTVATDCAAADLVCLRQEPHQTLSLNIRRFSYISRDRSVFWLKRSCLCASIF